MTEEERKDAIRFFELVAGDEPMNYSKLAIEALKAYEVENSSDAQPKWETCFDCPLSHGCPKIKGCTNEQAIEYASEIPVDCPLSVQPEIIRCKDCMYFHPSYCEIWSKFGTVQTREQGYCYMAERRTDV